MYSTDMVIEGPFTPDEILHSLERNNAKHTPGYVVLLSAWGHLVGYELPLGRLLSIFTGLLSLSMTYRLSRDFIATSAGLIALIIVVSNAFYNFYIPDARMYPLLVLTASIVLWLYMRIVLMHRPAKITDYLALTVACYALATAHVSSVMFFIALGVHLLLNIGKDRRWIFVTLAVLVAMLLYSPRAIVLISEGIGRSFRYWSTETASLGEIFGGWIAVTFNGSVMLLLTSVVGWILGIRARYFSPGAHAYIALYFLIVLGLVAQFTDALGENRLPLALAGWPAVLIFIVSGLYRLYRWRTWLGVLVLVWALAGILFQQNADWEAYFTGRELPIELPPWQVISRLAQQSDEPAPVFGYDYAPLPITWPTDLQYAQLNYYFAGREIELKTYPDKQRFATVVAYRAISVPKIRVFYQTSSADAAEVSRLGLIMEEANYRACEAQNLGVDTEFTVYAWQTLDCREPQILATFENELLNYEFYGATINASRDKVLYVDKWSATNGFDQDSYSLSHQLITDDWEKLASVDVRLVHEGSLRQFSIDITDVPAGNYRLMAILYDYQTGEKVDWIDNPGYVPSMLALAEIEIPQR